MAAGHWGERRIVSVFRLRKRTAGIVVIVVFVGRHGGQAPGAVLGSLDGTR